MNEQKWAVKYIDLKIQSFYVQQSQHSAKESSFSVHFDFQKDDTELYHRTLATRSMSTRSKVNSERFSDIFIVISLV